MVKIFDGFLGAWYTGSAWSNAESDAARYEMDTAESVVAGLIADMPDEDSGDDLEIVLD